MDEVVRDKKLDTYHVPFHWSLQAMTQTEAHKTISNIDTAFAGETLALDFIDREGYLKWRGLWRGYYMKISETIRWAKLQRKPAVTPEAERRSVAQHNCSNLGGIATALLLLLEEAKLRAAQQMGKPRARRYNHCRPPEQSSGG